jgi:hypothetical protein
LHDARGVLVSIVLTGAFVQAAGARRIAVS